MFAKLITMLVEILYFDRKKADKQLQTHVINNNAIWSDWEKIYCLKQVPNRKSNFFIDDTLEGGTLKFHSSVALTKDYANVYDMEINRYVIPETEAVIVFHNALPHNFSSKQYYLQNQHQLVMNNLYN